MGGFGGESDEARPVGHVLQHQRVGSFLDIGTSVEQITQGDTTDGGVYFFRNIDETNFVEIGVTSDDTSGGTFYPVLKLLAGEYSVGRLSNATIFAQADTAAVNLQFRMLSP